MPQSVTMCAPVLDPVVLPSKDIHLAVARSPSETQRQVWRTLRPAFMFSGDPTAADTLCAYGFACGQDVAAWHWSHLGEFLSDAEVQCDGVALADSTLAFEATHRGRTKITAKTTHTAMCNIKPERFA